MADDPSKRFLVLVHPGSACGSANFNLGNMEARAARESLIAELDAWFGHVLVVDGDLSDEIPDYPGFDRAVQGALARAAAAGMRSERVMGQDPAQEDRVRELYQALGDQAKVMSFEVTGAWYHPDDGSGCVGGVVDVLRGLGCSAWVCDSAVCLDAGEDCEDDGVELPGRQVG